MRQRLVLVVLVPTLGLGALGGFQTVERSRETSRAREVESLVERANVILGVKVLTANETFSTGALGAAVTLGVAPAVLAPILGFDPADRVEQDRAKVDRAVAAAEDPAVTLAALQLRTIRADLDAGRASVADVLLRYSQVQALLSDPAMDALTGAEDGAGHVASSATLRTDTEILRSAVTAATAVGFQLEAVAQLLIPSPDADRPAALDELRLGTVMYTDAAAVLDRSTTGPFRRRWQAVNGSAVARHSRAHAVELSALAPSEVPVVGLQDLAALVVEGMDSDRLHGDLAVAAAAMTVRDARHLRQRTERTNRVAGAVVLAVAAVALLLAGLISRSIARALQALAARAFRVTSGDLGDERAPRSGPREVREVSTTIEELVDNLRVVESQVGALAVGALADPSLEVPVPGRLGELLHDSMLGLSGAMAERERLDRRLAHDATHDPLTGLANRGSLLVAIRQALAEGGMVAVVKVDLDGFKPVKETHGHDTGDRLLRVTAARLRSEVGPRDLVARIGGDEFALVLTDLADPAAATVLAANAVARLADPVRVGVVVTQVRASAGVAIADGTLEAEELVRNAGLAVTAAKATGGGGVVSFDDAMLAEVVRRADVERRLRVALGAGELLFHLQPVVDNDLVTVGAEALIRWREPDGTLVAPGQFIPVAEASDLIIDVGRWVLREACGLLARWATDPALAHLQLAVNLSGRHVLSLTVVDDVRLALQQAGADPNRLTVEVTETVVLSDRTLATDHLRRLRELGVTIAIDDFGTGYTSLAHLRQLPVDVIKIDRSLVVDAAQRAGDARIVELVVGAAHAMGMTVVAEGIETAAQLDVLRAADCDCYQGFLLARPRPIDQVVAEIRLAVAQ